MELQVIVTLHDSKTALLILWLSRKTPNARISETIVLPGGGMNPLSCSPAYRLVLLVFRSCHELNGAIDK